MQRRPTLLRASRHRLPAPTSVGDISPQLGPNPPRDQVNEEEAPHLCAVRYEIISKFKA